MRALTSIRTRLALQVAVLLVVLPDSVRAEQEIPHWAFAAPTRDALPIGIQPVDHFIRLRLKEAGLKPSPRAAKHVLIRRLSFDLRGLPPTPEEVLRFLTDDSPEAWLKLVERFLASPHFGERLGQNWLDLARYADTSGYAADRTRNMWIYRDWVINAFNSNKRFDQFTIEQLAGDLLPHSDLNDKIATGFHRNAMQAKGNNPRKEEFRIKTVVDRLKTTGRTWLGLTLDCAECHDHKHDPISQKEYYQLFAIFNNVPHLGKGYDTHGPLMDFFSPEATRKRITIQEQINKLRKTLHKPHSPSDESLLGTWHKGDLSADAQAFSVTGDLTITAIINTREPVANIVSKNDWRGKQRSYLFGIGAEGEKSGPKGHLFAWISSQPDPWAGVEIYGSTPINDGKEHLVALVYHAGKSVRLFVDGVEDKAARIAGSVPDSIAVSERPLVIGAGYNNSTKPDAYRFQGVLREVRLYRKALADPGQLGPATVELQALQDELARLSPKPLRIPVMDELPKPRETYIHLRGNFKEKGERVFPAVPSILPPLAAGKTANRLTFAKWLMHPALLRHRTALILRGLRITGRPSLAPNPLGLAGGRVCGEPLEPERPRALDRSIGNLPAILDQHSSSPREGLGQPPSCTHVPPSSSRRADSRQRTRGERAPRSRGWWASCVSGAAEGPLRGNRPERARKFELSLEGLRWRGPLSQINLHLLETYVAPPVSRSLRRTTATSLPRETLDHQHASPGPRHPE